MASGKEIRTQITSIKSTQKITSAMEMVAASKMRKAQERMQKGKPYSNGLSRLLAILQIRRLNIAICLWNSVK